VLTICITLHPRLPALPMRKIMPTHHHKSVNSTTNRFSLRTHHALPPTLMLPCTPQPRNAFWPNKRTSEGRCFGTRGSLTTHATWEASIAVGQRLPLGSHGRRRPAHTPLGRPPGRPRAGHPRAGPHSGRTAGPPRAGPGAWARRAREAWTRASPRPPGSTPPPGGCPAAGGVGLPTTRWDARRAPPNRRASSSGPTPSWRCTTATRYHPGEAWLLRCLGVGLRLMDGGRTGRLGGHHRSGTRLGGGGSSAGGIPRLRCSSGVATSWGPGLLGTGLALGLAPPGPLGGGGARRGGLLLQLHPGGGFLGSNGRPHRRFVFFSRLCSEFLIFLLRLFLCLHARSALGRHHLVVQHTRSYPPRASVMGTSGLSLILRITAPVILRSCLGSGLSRGARTSHCSPASRRSRRAASIGGGRWGRRLLWPSCGPVGGDHARP
jgi:hypothetical protein